MRDRLHADAGYCGHNAPADYKFKSTIKTEAPRDPGDQARDAPSLGRRTRHNESQSHRTSGSYLYIHTDRAKTFDEG